MSGVNLSVVNKTSSSRPTIVTVIAILVLIIGVLNLIQLIQTIRLWGLLNEIISISPVVLIISGLVWGASGILIFVGMMSGKTITVRLLRLFAVLYVLYVWFDRIFLRTAPGKDGNNVFVLIISVIFIVIVFWALTKSNVKEYFGVAHEHRS